MQSSGRTVGKVKFQKSMHISGVPMCAAFLFNILILLKKCAIIDIYSLHVQVVKMNEVSVIIVSKNREYYIQMGKLLSKAGFAVSLREMDCLMKSNELLHTDPDIVIVNEILAEKRIESFLDICSDLPEIFFIFTSSYRNFEIERRISAMKNALFVLKPIDSRAFTNAIYGIAEDRKAGS